MSGIASNSSKTTSVASGTGIAGGTSVASGTSVSSGTEASKSSGVTTDSNRGDMGNMGLQWRLSTATGDGLLDGGADLPGDADGV